jgi:23S rRNA (adenine2503-C2)-methyltransferase
VTAPAENLIGLDRDTLARLLGEMGEKPFRATQILQWVHQRGVVDPEAMTDLSKALRTRLREPGLWALPEVAADTLSADGTRKWLLRLADGNAIETVYIPDEERGTLCISSQAGCALNCSFCATARQGFNRNLTSAEILGQVWRAYDVLGRTTDGNRPITNIVLMGMGEPLLNFDAVVVALKVLLDDFGYGLSRRRVTLSTAGMVPGIDALKSACPVSLAVSLHAADDALRDVLVPLNKKYPIAELLAACNRYVEAQPRSRVTFEYVMLEGVNDSVEQARRLARLLGAVPAKVNLIPFNAFPGAPYRSSDSATLDRFRDVLMRADIMTITRKTRGADIAAACGQLAGHIQDRTRRSQRMNAAAMAAHCA